MRRRTSEPHTDSFQHSKIISLYPMPERKKLSGAAYRKKRLLKEQEMRRLAELASTNVTNDASKQRSPDSETEKNPVQGVCDEEASTSAVKYEETTTDESDADATDVKSQNSQLPPENEATITDFSDPADWPDVIPISLQEIIVKKGPAKPMANFKYPKDASDRRFTPVHFKRCLSNGEEIHRNWMVYSPKKNRLYCFCCKLFTTLKVNLTTEGYSDWKNISQSLNQHEKYKTHIAAMLTWTEMSVRLGYDPIDKTHQRLLSAEAIHWQHVLERLVAIVKYLGKQCLTFRGSSDALYREDNGNYLKLVEMFAKFDTVMSDHLKKIHSVEVRRQFLGEDFQNEIIDLISKEITRRILQSLKASKYYSIILDCTPDIEDIEQISILVRFVSVEQNESPSAEPEVRIQERFLGFIPGHSLTGAGLKKPLLAELKRLNIPVKDMRGQGYDHGSNVKGKHSGVQRRILDLNSRAFHVPCSAHSLNVVITDAAVSCRDAVSFFGVVQKIYAFLSQSPAQWDVLKKHISKLTVQPLSETKWPSRIDAILPFRYQTGEIYDALLEISEDMTHDALARNDAFLFANELTNFRFLCSVVVWFHILQRVNFVSELLQSQELYLPDVLELLRETKLFLEEYRSGGFENVLQESRLLALEMEIDPVFHAVTPVRPRKRKSPSSNEEQECIEDLENQYKIRFFNTVLDVAIKAVGERLEQLQHHRQFFQFLYDIKLLKDVSSEDLLKYCMNLQELLTDPKSKHSDIDGIQLCRELTLLAPHVKPTMTLIQVLEFTLRNGLAPNVSIALRILLTLPVTVAPVEQSFSKQKLIQKYLLSAVSQEQQVGLAMISVENSIASEIDFGTLLHNFPSGNRT